MTHHLNTRQAEAVQLQNFTEHTCFHTAAAMDGMCPGKADWQQTICKSQLQAPALTKQDAAFEKEGCEYVWGLNELTVEDLNSLFKKARLNVCMS